MISINNLVLYTGFIVIINLILLQYVLKLERENCECSKGWMRDYIKYYTSTIIVLSLVMLIIPIVTNNKSLKKLKPLFIFIRVVVLLATLVQVYCVFTLSQKLYCEDGSCECSNSWHGRFMYWLGIFGFVVYTILVIAYLMCALTHGPFKCLA